jgi:hypothetical protein
MVNDSIASLLELADVATAIAVCHIPVVAIFANLHDAIAAPFEHPLSIKSYIGCANRKSR